MSTVFLYGWDAINSVWVKLVCNAAGKLIIDPSEIFEDPPTDGEAGKAATSNWSHDHAADANAHRTIHINAYNYTAGYLVATDIPDDSDQMFRLEILGNSHASLQIVDIKLQGYLYASYNDITRLCALAAHWTTNVSVFCYNGFLYFWFAQGGNYMSFSVFCSVTMDVLSKNRVTGITNAVKPTSGVTREYTVTPLVCYGS